MDEITSHMAATQLGLDEARLNEVVTVRDVVQIAAGLSTSLAKQVNKGFEQVRHRLNAAELTTHHLQSRNNSTGIYEVFLKSSPRFYGFIVGGSIIGGYYWSRMWDHYWAYENQGKLYAHCPYVYPPEEEE